MPELSFDQVLYTNADGSPRSLQDIELENAARDVQKEQSVTDEHKVNALAAVRSLTLTAATGFRVGSLGVDFSWSKPPVTYLDGHDFVMPYIPYPGDTGKSVTRDQVQAYVTRPKVVVMLWEVAAGDCLRGYDVGLAHGTQARISAYDTLGLPPGCTIIFACDTDTTWAAVKPYADGFSAGLGGMYKGGPYGGIKVTDPAVDAGYTAHQTIAWSGGVVGKAHILQNGFNYYPNGTAANCDKDVILRTPVGGWGENGFIPQEGFLMALTDAQQTDLFNFVTDLHNWLKGTVDHPNLAQGTINLADTVVTELAAIRQLVNAGNLEKAQIGALNQKLDVLTTAVANLQPGTVDVSSLATALAPLLPKVPTTFTVTAS